MQKHLIIFFSFFSFIFNTWSQVDLVYPKDSAVYNNANFLFEWNSEQNATTYHLQVSYSTSFNTPIIDVNNLSTTAYTPSNLNPNQLYYWRVKSNNSVWSSVRNFRIVDFRAWPELEIWLDADSVTIIGGKVSNWPDLSMNNNNFIQADVTKQPVQNSNLEALNGYSSIEFDSSLQNYFSGNSLASLNQGEIFSLLSINSQPSLNQLHTGLWSFGTATASSHYPWVDNNIYSSFGRDTRFSIGNISNSFNLTNFHLLNISSNNDFVFRVNKASVFTSSSGSSAFNSSVLLGKSKGNYFFNGKISELILFNTTLADSLRDLTNSYLRHKYAPPVNLGRDIVHSLCDPVLYAGKHFTSYLWSDGSTADSLIPSQSGTYWVEVEDIFGNISSDTIDVQLPETNYPTTQLYCPNDSIIWDTGLGQHYSFLWSDNSTADTLAINSPGDYHVTVTDTNGCIFKSDTLTFGEDPFSSQVSLGPDISLCSGNSIGLTSGANNATQYLWNTGATTPTILMDTSGVYDVVVENANACTAKDTVAVTVLGDAPIVQAQLPTEICKGEAFNYQDQSSTTDGSVINGWEWTFGNGDTSLLELGTQVYDSSGFFPITLTVETSAGCFNERTDTLQVRELPVLTFSTAHQCEGENIEFNGGQLSPASIAQWTWNFGDPASGSNNTATGQNVDHVFDSFGSYAVQLIGEDVFGCIDTLVQNKNIVPTPVADFTFNEVCEGNTVQFQNTSTVAGSNNIASNQWSFGDGTNSNQNNPQKPYSAHGTYTVELSTTANNGCSHSTSQDIKIHAIPQVGNTITQNCAGLSTLFSDESFVPDGSVAEVDWKFGNTPPINGIDITKTFANSGVYTLEQTVKSGFGCLNSQVENLTINAALKADFTFSPQAFIADYPIQFESTSIGATAQQWTFGNFATSQQVDTSIIFDSTQIGSNQEVELVVENQYDCYDTMRVELPVLEERTDLELAQLFTQESNGFLTIGVQLRNNGSTPILSTDLILRSPGTGLIKETWSGELQASEEEIYIFTTSPAVNAFEEDQEENHLCIEGKIVSPVQFQEEDFSNNEVCKSTSEDQTVVVNPYPNPVQDELSVKVILPKSGAITMKVFNNNGQLMQVITEKSKGEKGLNEFKVSTQRWSSGKYWIYVASAVEGVDNVVVEGVVVL